MNNGRNVALRKQVVIVADDARVVRVSELRELYEIAGDYRTVGEALGVSASTVCRALQGDQSDRASRAERLAAVKERLDV